MMKDGDKLAAIDLGSNSFRLEIWRWQHGQLQRIEYIKEPVRLGAGLNKDRALTQEAMQRGWACLARFAERLTGFPKNRVRAVATQTLREARNRQDFLAHAATIIDHPIEVISGQEEARLIYLGVSRLLAPSQERRLLIDIGGRSTEIILGQGLAPELMESYRVGCVSLSMKHFDSGEFTRKNLDHAVVDAKSVMEPVLSVFKHQAWDVAYGSSGTVGALADIVGAQKMLPHGTASSINYADLLALKDLLIERRDLKSLKLDGMRDDRKSVIAGGLAALLAVFELLKLKSISVAQGALRHGVAFDLIERTAGSQRNVNVLDQRDLSVARLQRNFQIDMAQAQRVSALALEFHRQLRSKLNEADDSELHDLERKLMWSAQLHEIGCHISHTDSHKHGAYILDNSDALGFSFQELHDLSLLVLGQRGKLHKLNADFLNTDFVFQLASLRLAVLLCHARSGSIVTDVYLKFKSSQSIVLRLPSNWENGFAQSAYLLENEIKSWKKVGWDWLIEEK